MTIYALSSGPGVSGIAVIRVSGKSASKVIKKLTDNHLPTPRVATLKKVKNIANNELIDEAIILWFPGPDSYTGEDLAEFHIHGSQAVISAIHNEISKIKSCRLADPGEFTRRAFQNGKVNLLKAESIADLISSETEIQRKQAINVMTGKSSKQYNIWREKLLKILSHVEAKIDFPDEDLPSKIDLEIKKVSKKILKEIKINLDDHKVGEKIREGLKIAIVGPANVGKSSLINYLSKREIAIVSETAGTTRDVIETHLNFDGFPVIVSDTAGIRESKDEIEKKGVQLALKKAENADLNIVVIEPKTADFKGFFNVLDTKKSILVINKSDLGTKKIKKEFKKYKPIIISLKKQKNLKKLLNKIKNKLKKQFVNSENILITRERHRENLEECAEHLQNFIKKKTTDDFDKAAEDLRLATRYLGIIVGKIDVEEILDSIFNDFCIGK
tara:strand:+ start:826 stop:2157 length:1332 start_codon:yes stop_codon:yes gene_type:complete